MFYFGAGFGFDAFQELGGSLYLSWTRSSFIGTAARASPVTNRNGSLLRVRTVDPGYPRLAGETVAGLGYRSLYQPLDRVIPVADNITRRARRVRARIKVSRARFTVLDSGNRCWTRTSFKKPSGTAAPLEYLTRREKH